MGVDKLNNDEVSIDVRERKGVVPGICFFFSMIIRDLQVVLFRIRKNGLKNNIRKGLTVKNVAARVPVKKPVASSEKNVAKRNIQNQLASEPPLLKKALDVPAPPKPLMLPANVNLKVAEIFYQEDPANRMAVVNDLPVMVGTPVEGALVQEIRPDHVIFRVNSTI